MAFNFSIQTIENSLHIQTQGEMVINDFKKFQASLLYLVQKGINRIIVDMRKIVMIDYACGAFLQKVSEAMEKTDRKIAFLKPISPEMEGILDNLNLVETLPWFNSINEAISYFDSKAIMKIEDVLSTLYQGMTLLIEDAEGKKYPSLVMKKYESTIWLNWPKNKEKNLIKVPEILKCVFLKKEGIFQFETAVHRKIFEPQPILVLKKPQETRQVEIRNFYRYQTRLVVQFRIFYDNKPPSQRLFMGVCTDLSAGGIQLESQQPLNQYDYVIIYMQIPGYTLNNIIGKIVRVSRGEKGKFIYGVKFTSIFEIDRLKIENYILDKMNLKDI